MTSLLNRRLAVLENITWDRRKRRILRDAFADVARESGWTAERLAAEVQAALDEFGRLELMVSDLCRRGAPLDAVMGYIAKETGLDVLDLRAETEDFRRRLTAGVSP